MTTQTFEAAAQTVACLSGADVVLAAWRRPDGRLQAQLWWESGRRLMMFDYDDHLAPCRDIPADGTDLVIAADVIGRYPGDRGLVQVQAQAYLGRACAAGHLALLYPQIWRRSAQEAKELLDAAQELLAGFCHPEGTQVR